MSRSSCNFLARATRFATGLALVLGSAACAASGSPWSRNVAILVGERELQESSDWAPVEKHPVGGLEFDSRDPDTGWGYEIGASYSEKRDTQSPLMSASSAVGDLWFGGRKTFNWPTAAIHPFISAGATALYGERELVNALGTDKREDLEPGVYAQIGLYGYLHEVLIGVGYRVVREDFITNDGLNLDYDQWAVRLGLSF